MRRYFTPIRSMAARFLNDTRGVALIEFAYSIPLLMVMGLGGAEVTNYAVTHMRVSQIAVSLADNASRAKQEIVSGVPRMREYDVNEAFLAAALQGGNLDMQSNGRMILSSLQTNESDGQWIQWQRCFGDADYASTNGVEGDGATGTDFAGMGTEERRVTAEEGFAVMFAEVVYNYEPLILNHFVPDTPIRKEAAMYVRDDRDLTQIYNPSPAAPVNNC